MLQRYNFIYIKSVLYKKYFHLLTFVISNSYGLQETKMSPAYTENRLRFRRKSGKSIKNRTPPDPDGVQKTHNYFKINNIREKRF